MKLVYTAALIALLILTSSPRAAGTLPSELSNGEFREIISSFSEAEDSSRYTENNYVSNELYYQTVIPLIRARTMSGGVYMGVGPEQNFTYIAAFQPQLAFIVDIRRQNLLEHLMFKALFEMASDRADFVSFLFSRKRPVSLLRETTSVDDLVYQYAKLTPDDNLYQTTIERILERLVRVHQLTLSSDDVAGIRKIFTAFRDNGVAITINGPVGAGYPISFEHLMAAGDTQGQTDIGHRHSFLSTEDAYRFVRSMHLKNLIVPLVGDFGGPKTIRAVGAYTRGRSEGIRVFYISNVTGYLGNSFDAFVENVRTLPFDSTSALIIGADRPGIGMDRVPPGILRGMFSSFVFASDLMEEIQQGKLRSPADLRRISR